MTAVQVLRRPEGDGSVPQPARVLRIIARMNLGGPAYHVSLLSGRLPRDRYLTRLLTGRVGAGEESFEDVAARYGATVVTIPHLRPEMRPADDARALMALVREIRFFRPHIIHTHTAKAGALGRTAALLARTPTPPKIVHTFHGHVLTGYFGVVETTVYRALERQLARRSDRLIGVSGATMEELLSLGVGSRERFQVVPLGLELGALLGLPPAPARLPAAEELRARLGIPPDTVVATFVGRLVHIKRLDVLLRATAAARRRGVLVRLLIVGDGDRRPLLEQLTTAEGLGGSVHFLGYRRDLDVIASATDLAVLSSDNEGTPVALIEAAAASRPAVATDVGGVKDIVTADTGRTVPAGDAPAFARALTELCSDAALRARLGAAAREQSRNWQAARLLADIDELYRALLTQRSIS